MEKLVRPILFMANLYAAAVTNASLAILKLFAVARPLHFRDGVHVGICVKIVVFR